ncbi:hypothetical protein B0H13DRAFT_2332327 [Mycena leptocephala]|nr:hypothetical protein B0H13DRAFT_2332327 [Mycena leptocephala]
MLEPCENAARDKFPSACSAKLQCLKGHPSPNVYTLLYAAVAQIIEEIWLRNRSNHVNMMNKGPGAMSWELFDKRKLVVLKTPNLILDTADVPNRSYIGRDLKYGVKYSEKDRYTLQSLTSTETIRDDIANNLDAAFKLHSKKPKPSPLLLHYNYGVAAVLWWGKGQSRLHASNRPNVPRPKVPVPDPMGPPRVTHNRQVTRDKLENARAEGTLQGAGSAIGQSEQDADRTYAEELVLSLWASTGVAHDRRENEAEEYAYRMERWQAGGLFV